MEAVLHDGMNKLGCSVEAQSKVRTCARVAFSNWTSISCSRSVAEVKAASDDLFSRSNKLEVTSTIHPLAAPPLPSHPRPVNWSQWGQELGIPAARVGCLAAV